ncbi:MAG: acyl-CoA/acyl-ACP dehydrogenase [Chloroflexi bacterium]|nr:acyl-CoA/acyl-ACP dehydrogenase [Chloroflexota bacterium]
MNLSLTESQQLLKNSAREFLERELPREEVRRIDDSPNGFSPDLWRKLVSLGYTATVVPEAYGGQRTDFTDAAVLMEELGRALAPGPFFSSAVFSALIIETAGNENQKRTLLPEIAQGRRIVVPAVTEADYGWDPEHIKQVTATRRGTNWVLNGAKFFVPDAQLADQLIVAARTGARGITLFLVGGNQTGVNIRNISGWFGDKLNEVTLSKVSVEASHVLGTVHRGWPLLESAMEKATLLLCSYMVGGTGKVYDMTVDYSQRRIQFGRPIGTFQRVQDHAIEGLNYLDAARWLTYEALWKLDTNKPAKEVTEAVSMAKTAASEGYRGAAGHAHEVHAGVGVDKETGLYLYTKMARTLYHYLGSPQQHKKRIAELLGI